MKSKLPKLALKDVADRYYTELDDMLNDLAVKCTGGEEVRLVFPAGSITIKLK